MLQLVIPEREIWDESTDSFTYSKETTLKLEHSLVSVSKWESKWKKSFLNPRNNLTPDEYIDYVKCMTLNEISDENVYLCLTQENIKQINDYIADPMTATTINSKNNKKSSKLITSEVVYSWMIYYGIPVEFEMWHLNRLMTLIGVCAESESSGSSRKMSNKDLLTRNMALNKQRKAAMGSRG